MSLEMRRQTRNSLALVALSAVVASGCGDPRAALGQLNVPYTAEAFVAQAGEGDTAAVKLFLKSGISPDSRGDSQSTALITASSRGYLDVVKALLDNGADPNLKNDDGMTALAGAAGAGHIEIARRLLDKGADVAAEKPVDRLPLMRAIRSGHQDIVRLLLDRGAPAYVQDDQWSPLILASFLGQPAMVDAFIAKNVDVNARNSRGMTSLMHAASRGHVAVVATLLDHGADINAQDSGGHTALMFAANNGQLAAVRLLVDHHADPRKQNRAGATAASLAAANGHRDVVQLLAPDQAARPPDSRDSPDSPDSPDSTSPPTRIENPLAALIFPDERRLYSEASASAWRYVDRHYRRSTGLIDATDGYAFATIWDIGSGLAALYAGHELSLIATPEYDRRIRRALGTLASVNLFDKAAFNKVYSTTDGAMVDGDGRPSARGHGWSAIDVGRLLVWLHIIATNQPQYRAEAERVAGRLAMDRIVSEGYLHGEDLDAAGAPRRYQEGRLGYEQYAARGFSAWHAPATRARGLRENGVPITVMGQELLADLRGGDRVTSDPLILLGLELGWDAETAPVATAFLAAQEARYRHTGRVTLAGEDAISRPPYFFYYYCAFTNGKDFGIDVQHAGAVVDDPRWVSTKAAFAWHALRPSAYTELALRSVKPAQTANGWGSGVYENSGTSTGTLNINTAAVILEAALMHARGVPILK